jgi:hypothetical protein
MGDCGVLTTVNVKLSNKKWLRRLKLILKLEQWVASNLKGMGPYDKYERTPRQKATKGKEYLYGYLFWGRRRFPESPDPLFFIDDGGSIDQSLDDQLNEGVYSEFVSFFNREVEKFMANINTAYLENDVTREVYQSFGARNTNHLLDNVFRSCHVSDLLRNLVEIGLFLRYRCIGGFEINLHGSIPGGWKNILLDFTECFASPFNHKLDVFHSMFEEDCVFGSRGDFFKFVSINRGLIPSGKYEINPPFHLDVLDEVAGIVEKSFASGKDLWVFMAVPNWEKDNPLFIEKLKNTSDSLGEWGCEIVCRYRYIQPDGNVLPVDSRFYIFVSNDIEKAIVSDFIRLCKQEIGTGTFRSAATSFSDAVDRYLKHRRLFLD